MNRVGFLLALGIAAVGAASCSKVHAKTPAPAPVPLALPEPPGRLQIPVSADPPPAPAVVDKPPAPNTPALRPRPTPPPTSPPPASTTSGETTPPPVVQTGSQAEHEARARDKLAAAEKDLSRVQPKSLSREARDQYDSATRFIKMTKDALSARNFLYAASCAEKAAILAALLVKG